MDVKFKNLTKSASFKELASYPAPDIKDILSAERVSKCNIKTGIGLDYNYSAKPVDKKMLGIFQQVANEQQAVDKYKKVLYGAIMNPGENRMVLHHYTRGTLDVDHKKDVTKRINLYSKQIERFSAFAEKVHNGKIKGSTGAKFDTAVQIGIGGSDLGPRALYLALKGYMQTEGKKPLINCEFISNVDPDDASDVMSRINPETTLFIVVSKSGTTQETLTNTALVKSLIKSKSKSIDIAKHMIAVTGKGSPMENPLEFSNSFYIDDFIGGRYSGTSAVGGVILSLAFGSDIFKKVLAGAHANDKIALQQDILKNPPLLDALLSVYDRNILKTTTEAILPYSQALSRFPAHLQQLIMESNGKSANFKGKPINYETSPVVFGEPGTNGQHSFYQMLHQGTDIVPLKFIGFKESQQLCDVNFEESSCQKKLNANLAAQITAFALGQKDENPNKNFIGGRSSDILIGKKLTPEALGSLLAHFENRTMFQGFLWNINSFDQEGVQLGKKLANKILSAKSGDANMQENPVLDAYSALFT
ncbi:MAG: glucose-6-phosphate isomerase [Spirochaetes bacterium]|nr:glucose-6-phosphate isomerase [Spirochaetota bacterium]